MENVISFQSLELYQEYKVLGYSVVHYNDNGLIFLIIKWNEGESYPDQNVLYELLSTGILHSYVFNYSINETFNFIVRVNASGILYPEFLNMKRKYILYNDTDECDIVDKEVLDDLNNNNNFTLNKLCGLESTVTEKLNLMLSKREADKFNLKKI